MKPRSLFLPPWWGAGPMALMLFDDAEGDLLMQNYY
jgi:hypothetical protein